MRASLLLSPRPAALLVRRVFAATGRRPVLLWVHGGGWVGGSKDELLGYFKRVASHGYAAAVGVTPTITATQLRGLVLACDPYDAGLADHVTTPRP